MKKIFKLLLFVFLINILFGCTSNNTNENNYKK